MKLAPGQLRRWVNLRDGFSPVNNGSRWSEQHFLVYGQFHPANEIHTQKHGQGFHWYVIFVPSLDLGLFDVFRLEQYSEVLSEISSEG